MKRSLSLLLLTLGLAPAQAQTFGADVVLEDLPVHATGDMNVFATRFDYREGQIFLAQVEPGTGLLPIELNLSTVVYKGTRDAESRWTWERTVIEPRTLLDTWHTQVSITLDKRGFVHVAYNMHNMPWQYAVSSKPFDISSFNFQGQPLAPGEREAVKLHNRTQFPTIGSAAIPGNQITYPAFFTDRKGDIYITYRFATSPAKKWESRGLAGAIARYDSDQGKWHPVGGALAVPAGDVAQAGERVTQYPFAFEKGYTPYLVSLAFDRANRMHAFWNWREGGPGEDTFRPSYAHSVDGRNFVRLDGKSVVLPVDLEGATKMPEARDGRRYYAPKSVAAHESGQAMTILQPTNSARLIWSVDTETGQSRVEPSPGGASSIAFDNAGNAWAFATGIKVFRRPAGQRTWTYLGQIGDQLCAPYVRYFPVESRFFLHAKSCSTQAVSIFSFAR